MNLYRTIFLPTQAFGGGPVTIALDGTALGQYLTPSGPFVNVRPYSLSATYPASVVSSSKLTGAYTDVDDDAYSPDANWLTFNHL